MTAKPIRRIEDVPADDLANHQAFYKKVFDLPQIITRWFDDYGPISGKRILDFGCGIGETALGFSLRYPDSQIFGIDIKTYVDGLLWQANTRLNLETKPKNLNITQVSPGEIPQNGGKYDLIYSWSVVEHIDRDILDDTIDLIRNSLADDGRLFIQIAPLYYSAFGHHVSWSDEFKWKHLTRQNNTFASDIAKVAETPAQEASLASCYNTLNRITAEELKILLEDHGFFIEKQYRTTNVEGLPEYLLYAYRRDILECEQVIFVCRKSIEGNQSPHEHLKPAEFGCLTEDIHTNAVRKLGNWWSDLPTVDLGVGKNLFLSNEVVRLCNEQLGSVHDFSTLEVGPRDGYHTYALEKAGANVIAIEQNFENYLRCIQVKNQYDMRAKFLYGNVADLIENLDRKFDLTFLSGVVYHFKDPVDLVKKLLRKSNRAFVWTHYFDEELIKNNISINRKGSRLRDLFSGVTEIQYDGKTYRYHKLSYQEEDFRDGSFSGGVDHYASWLEKDQLLSIFVDEGFDIFHLKTMDHSGGPAIQFSAKRR